MKPSATLGNSSKLSSFLTSISISEATAVLFVSLITVIIVRIGHKVARPFLSPLRDLKGPQSGYLFGNLKDIRSFDNGVWQETMIETYGPVLIFRKLFGANTLLTVDTKAVEYVLNNATAYERLSPFQWVLRPILGQAVLSVNGAVHKRQRRIINPAFNTGHIREITETFVQKSQELKDILLSKLPATEHGPSEAKVDVMDYMARATLDIIGLTGFNYSFGSLMHKSNEFSDAFGTITRIANEARFSADRAIALVLKGMIPILRPINIDQRSKDMKTAVDNIARVSNEVIEAQKRQLISDEEGSNSAAEDKGKFETGKDILSLIMRANASLGKDVRSLSDVEMTHQIPAFLTAGHETTANATVWTLASLAVYPKVQIRLRNEILSCNVESPTMDQLNSLPYLDKVARESLRYHSIVGFVERVASQNDVIPVETPYKDRHGQVKDHIAISKGDTVHIPLIAINHSKLIWGEDAKAFNPDRWEAPPTASYSIPGIWGNQFTFGGGVRACIGFKFAVIEMKALLYTLIKALEFELAVPFEEFDKVPQFIKKPLLKSDPLHGQMPMIIRRAPTELVRLDD